MPDVRTQPVRAHDLVGAGLALVAAVTWFALGWVRWHNVRAGASDLGIFDQAAWLMSRGRAPFVTSIGVNVFADHVSPVVVVFAGLYRIVATPAWLLGVQAAALGLTVVPMRALARELGSPSWLGAALTICSPFLWSAAIYDVHPVVLATPAVAWALLAARRGDVRLATVAGVAVALCRADAVSALVGIAIVAQPVVRRRLLLLVPVPLVAAVVIPRWLGTWQTFGHYYGRLGTSWGDALTHPWRAVVAVVAPTSLLQMLLWLLPLGFLPLARPRWLAALLVAGAPLLMSSWPGIAAPWYHHAAFLVPIGVGGALAGWACVRAGATRPVAMTRWALAIGAVVALLTASPFSAMAPDETRMTEVLSAPPASWHGALEAVGPTESESSPNTINGHLSERVESYNFPCPFPGVPGGRRCDHPNLLPRARHVAVVVLPGSRDLNWLAAFGRWRISHDGGATVARRVGTTRR